MNNSIGSFARNLHIENLTPTMNYGMYMVKIDRTELCIGGLPKSQSCRYKGMGISYHVSTILNIWPQTPTHGINKLFTLRGTRKRRAQLNYITGEGAFNSESDYSASTDSLFQEQF